MNDAELVDELRRWAGWQTAVPHLAEAADRLAALAAERDAAVGRVAELEAALKPFASAPPDPADNMLYAVYFTGAALRRAAELLARKGVGGE